ncbi:MAG: hypothetical protein EA339_08880 [Rhodobacteraceae bacterium]|nr:MAG: hypothetical protein EA339_08880 [Paracoccaceae bacterium]
MQWIFAAISFAKVLAFVLTILLWAVDARAIEGGSVWAKPLKFELSLAIHAITLRTAFMGRNFKFGFKALWTFWALTELSIALSGRPALFLRLWA